MKFKLLTYFALLFLVGNASAQSLYLTCKATSYPDLNVKTIYKVVPVNAPKQFMTDMLNQGLYSVIRNKSESWVVNLPEARITSPDGSDFANAVITDIRISANGRSSSGSVWSYDINRITGKLTYQISLDEEARKAWKTKHGGTLPILWTWEQVCTAASSAKI